jgi:hypothetical protein
MTRQFEVFTGRFKPTSDKAMRVTLNTRGVFSLNDATYTALGKPGHVELLYDRASRVIGMRPVVEGTKHAYPVRTQKNAKSYLVGATAFYHAYELHVKEGLMVFDPAVEEGILILEQDKATAIASRPRRNTNDDKQAKTHPLALSLEDSD